MVNHWLRHWGVRLGILRAISPGTVTLTSAMTYKKTLLTDLLDGHGICQGTTGRHSVGGLIHTWSLRW